MKCVTAYRANKILHNFLASNNLLEEIVALPTNICTDVVEMLRYVHMQLRFVDIAANTLCMNEQTILNIVKDIQVLLMVHTYGVEYDFSEFFLKVREVNPNIVIIDDKCLCLPEWKMENSVADLVLYSLGSKKQVNMGEGAIGFVADKWNYEEVMVEENGILENRSYTWDKQVMLAKMDDIIAHKEKLNAIYRANLPSSIQFPEQFQHWRFNIWVENKARILESLFEGGVFASSHYKPIQSAEGFLPIMGETEEGAIAQKLYDHVINLFNDQYFTEQQALETCRIINANI